MAKEIEPSLQFQISAFIPDPYIPDTYQRLSIYKRLSGCEETEEIDAIRAELEDRYGPCRSRWSACCRSFN